MGMSIFLDTMGPGTYSRGMDTTHTKEKTMTALNTMERAALDHARAQLRYERSSQAVRDRRADKVRRATCDARHGHVPECGLLRCAPGCISAVRP
mgnify:CR=1 FL=1